MTLVGSGGLVIRGFDRKATFDKTLKRHPELHEQVKEALNALKQDPRPKWIRFEKLSQYRNPAIYSIHVTKNHSHKITFEVEGDIAILRKLATHKEIDRNP